MGEMLSAMDELSSIYGFFGNLVDLLTGTLWVAIIVAILLVVVPYVFIGYMIMCTGRKAGLESDWMAYVPVARELYQMQIAGSPWWYIFLFKSGLVHYLIYMLLLKIIGYTIRSFKLELTMFLGILIIAYTIAVLVFTYFHYKEFYPKFGFHPNTAFIEVIWTCGIIGQVLQAFIAFSHTIQYSEDGSVEPMPPYSSRGMSGGQAYEEDGRTMAIHAQPPVRAIRPAQITGISGKYAGAAFDISDGAEVVFGRSAAEANIVFDQFETDISRRHCTVHYDQVSDQFIVTDCSTNGTYRENGSRFGQKLPVSVERGTVIYLGKNKKNSFRLG